MFQLRIRLSFGAIGLTFFLGSIILGTNLVRNSLGKHIPAMINTMRQASQLDGYHAALDSNRSNEALSSHFSMFNDQAQTMQ